MGKTIYVKADGSKAKKASKKTASYELAKNGNIKVLPSQCELTEQQRDALWKLVSDRLDERIVSVKPWQKKAKSSLAIAEANWDDKTCEFSVREDASAPGIRDNKDEIAEVFMEWAEVMASSSVPDKKEQKKAKKAEEKAKKAEAKIEKAVENDPLKLSRDDLVSYTEKEIEKYASGE